MTRSRAISSRENGEQDKHKTRLGMQDWLSQHQMPHFYQKSMFLTKIFFPRDQNLMFRHNGATIAERFYGIRLILYLIDPISRRFDTDQKIRRIARICIEIIISQNRKFLFSSTHRHCYEIKHPLWRRATSQFTMRTRYNLTRRNLRTYRWRYACRSFLVANVH